MALKMSQTFISSFFYPSKSKSDPTLLDWIYDQRTIHTLQWQQKMTNPTAVKQKKKLISFDQTYLFLSEHFILRNIKNPPELDRFREKQTK